MWFRKFDRRYAIWAILSIVTAKFLFDFSPSTLGSEIIRLLAATSLSVVFYFFALFNPHLEEQCAGRGRFFKVSTYAILALGTVFFIFWDLSYVERYGTNYPYVDDLSFLSFADSYVRNTLSLEALFSQFNEHRVFFHRVIMIGMLYLFSGNFITLTYLTQAFLFVSIVVFFLKLSRQFRSDGSSLPLWTIAFPVFIYSTFQSENFIWACQVVYTDSMVIPLVSFFLLDRYFEMDGNDQRRIRGAVGLTLIIAMNTVSSFMSSMGLLVWPSMIFQLLLTRTRKLHRPWFLLFGCAVLMAIQWFFYFHGLERLENHSPEKFILTHTIEFIQFYLTLLGKGLFINGTPALVTGTILFVCFTLCSFLAFLHDNYSRRTSFWLTISVFILLQALAVSVGRAEFGYFIDYDRYALYSLWLIPCVMVCLYHIHIFIKLPRAAVERIASTLATMLFLCMVPFTIENYRYGENLGQAKHYDREFFFHAHRFQKYYTADRLDRTYNLKNLILHNHQLANLGFLPLPYEIDRSRSPIFERKIEVKKGSWWRVREENNVRIYSSRNSQVGQSNRRLTFRNIPVTKNSFIEIDVKYGMDTGGFGSSSLVRSTQVGIDFDMDGKTDKVLMPYSISSKEPIQDGEIFRISKDKWYTLVYFVDKPIHLLNVIVKNQKDSPDSWIEFTQPKVYLSKPLRDDERFRVF